jgi:hypothetical protein
MATGASDAIGLGLSTAAFNTSGGTGQAQVMSTAIWVNGGISSSFPSIANGDVIGIAVDLTAQLVWFRICPSGTWNGSGTANPATGVGGISISSISTGLLFPMYTVGASVGNNVTANFGASAFSGALPSGFTSGWLGAGQPAMAGYLAARVQVGKANAVYVIDPQPVLS